MRLIFDSHALLKFFQGVMVRPEWSGGCESHSAGAG